MTPSNEQIRAAVAEQAHEWFVENRGVPLDRQAATRFMAWLKTSPMHMEEYLVTVALAGDLKKAANTARISLELLLARARAESDTVVEIDRPIRGTAPAVARNRMSPVRALAAAAAMAFVAVMVLWMSRDGERFGLPKTYRTAHGEQSVQMLPDGTVLSLNTDSQVTVHFSRRERLIELEHGQAFFQVRHGGGRAFRVSAGNAQVVDAGTQFDVYRRPDTVLVSVLEGVAAVYSGAPQLASSGSLPPVALRLPAGYQVEVGGHVGVPRPVEDAAAGAWLRKQIVFSNEPLGAVADEFNRYGKIAIEIDDRALRSLPITGVFDAYDTDSFVAFLATLKDVVVERTASRIRVFRRPPTLGEPIPKPK